MVERMADMEDRSDAEYIVVDNSIFVIGGDPEPCTRVQEFLVRERRWLERASLDVERLLGGHAIAAVRVAAAGGEETLIGVFGGWSDGSLSASDVYDVRQDSWHRLPDLREKRWDAAAASVPGDSRIFVFGGYNGSSDCLASVVYCQFGADWRERRRTASSADFWQPAAPMRTARGGLAATALRGGILVAGGCANRNRLNVVELFSLPDANHPRGQWTEVAGMKKSRWDFTLLTSPSGTVFALGDDNTVETLTAPDVAADPKSWVWCLKNPLETFSYIRGAGIIRL